MTTVDWSATTTLACSINYSKLLGGHKYFFGLARDVVDPNRDIPRTQAGAFVLLVCGSADKVLVLPRSLVLEFVQDVPTRRVDIFIEDGTYILQTTGHPKLDVTDYLNAFPPTKRVEERGESAATADTADRLHARVQWSLIQLGRAEGCSVWVPTNDRNLSYRGRPFADWTVAKLPNFGFEENTRRIVQNIDVLWLTGSVITKAIEIEATTSIYSGLLRLNDLVLAQPNNHIDLYIAAALARRERVEAQLTRPSFRTLLPRCQFVAFEFIEKQWSAWGLSPWTRGYGSAG